MHRVLRLRLTALALCSVGCASSTATINTFSEPSADFGIISSVAVLPMRNTSFVPSEARVVNRRISQEFARRNPAATVVGPAEAAKLLNDNGLADDYAVFLTNYVASGIPDAELLGVFGEALAVDALIQGEVVNVYQEDGGSGNKGVTRVTLRFTMLGCQTGTLLWEATRDGRLTTALNTGAAPPIIEAVHLAVDKIITTMPRVGQR